MNGRQPHYERITTAEAARRLGLHVATVRRKVAAGELPGEREARPGGARWWVLWTEDLPAHDRAHESAHARTDARDALALALRMIESLERDKLELHARLSEALAALNARALPAPAPAHEPAPARTPRPWWQPWKRR